MVEPTYFENEVEVIRGDAKELVRHMMCLADDLSFCTGHNAVRAIEKFDTQARRIYGDLDKSGKASLATVSQHVRRHPVITILAACAIGALLATALHRPTRNLA